MISTKILALISLISTFLALTAHANNLTTPAIVFTPTLSPTMIPTLTPTLVPPVTEKLPLNPNAQNIELVGHFSATVKSFFVQQDYAYLAAGQEGLQIVDISDPTAPTLVGTHEFSGSIDHVAVTGTVAVALDDGDNLLLLDVSTPAAPVERGQYTLPEKGYQVVVAGNYAYIPAGDSGLRLVDISMPDAPTEVGVYQVKSASSVAVAGDYAYLLSGGLLHIVDITNPTAPIAIRFYRPLWGWLAGVRVVGERLYLTIGMGTDYTLVKIFDLADPTTPIPIETEYDLPLDRVYGLDLAASDDTLYLVPAWGGLRMIDVSEPVRPIETGFYNQTFDNAKVIAAGGRVYVADQGNGLFIFKPHPVEMPEPTQVVALTGHFGGETNAVFVQNDYAYVGFGPEMAILDIADPTTPSRSGYLVLPDSHESMVQAITVVDTYAYVAASQGLWVVDVADPTRPLVVGYTLIEGGQATDVTVRGRYAYLTQFWNSGRSGSGNMSHGYFKVVDVSDPAHPFEVSAFKTSEGGGATNYGARAVQVINNYAYVADSARYGLRVFDLSAPASPVEVGNSTGGAEDFVLRDGYAYTTNGYPGAFRVIDISDPTTLNSVGAYETLGRTGAVALLDDYAYFVEDPPLIDFKPVGDYGLRVMDVSNPITPTTAGFYPTAAPITDVTIKDRYAYLAMPGALHSLHLVNPTNPVEIGVYQTLPPAVSEISIVNDHAYVATGNQGENQAVYIVDISNPAEPVTIKSLVSALGPNTPVVDGYTYLIDNGDLRILKVSDTDTFTQVGVYTASIQVEDRIVSAPIHTLVTRGNYAYAILDGGYSFNWRLVVLDLSNPVTPTQVYSYALAAGLQELHLEIVADHLYLVGDKTKLRIFDISELPNLVEVDIGQEIFGEHMTVRNGHAYVTGQRLQILDISDPAHPVIVGTTALGLFGTRWSIKGIAVDDTYAYLIDDAVGLRVIDIANPTAPFEVGFSPIPGAPLDLALANDYIWVATQNSGLFPYRLIPADETSSSNNILPPIPPVTVPVLTSTLLATPTPIGTLVPLREEILPSH